ncbi:1932_t:CDS:2, partial [Funneliformis geosporum]
MTATLRTTKYMHYTLPDSIGEETIVNEYFKKVEAQYWQLKHYLNYRLRNERVIIPWVQIYEDCFEGVSVLESCMRWYNKFYERNFELQFAERVRQLETDILHCNFSSQRMAGLTNERGLVEPQSSMISATDEDGASISPRTCFNNNETSSWEGCEKNLNVDQDQEIKAEDENDNTICVKSILEDTIIASKVEKELTDLFFKNFPKTPIMDLRPKSKLSLSLNPDLQKEVLHEIFDYIDNNYITNEIHEYLINFFNEDHSARGWDDAINNTIISNTDSDILMNTKKLIKETLPKFLKAFSLTTLNPLRDITILEKPHLNQFVHPIIDSALWIFAKVNYIYGEIPLKGMKTKVRADGVGFLNDVINYPIVCGEGARPGASQQKSVDDDVKNAKSMVELYNNIVISEADARRQLFTDLRTYGITAFKTEVSLTMMDFRSTHRLFEVDNFGLPRDWADMPNFAWLYEAVIKWALCVNATRGALIDHRKKRR